MKLLLDENISCCVLRSISEDYPGGIHVSDELGLKEEYTIFLFAKQNQF
jgi:hypothetical protein